MKYILKTEVNENGNEVFSKERRGKGFVYIARDEKGNYGIVTKDWILRNKNSIINLGVNKDDSIYPRQIHKLPEKHQLQLRTIQMLPSHRLESIANILKSYNIVSYPVPNSKRILIRIVDPMYDDVELLISVSKGDNIIEKLLSANLERQCDFRGSQEVAYKKLLSNFYSFRNELCDKLSSFTSAEIFNGLCLLLF